MHSSTITTRQLNERALRVTR